jgi:hypothetical protein
VYMLMCHIICLSVSIHDLSFSIRNIIGTHISVVNAAALLLNSDSANSNLKLGAISHINNPS